VRVRQPVERDRLAATACTAPRGGGHDPDPGGSGRRGPDIAGAGPVLFAASFGLGQYWQYEIRHLMGVTDYSIPLVVAEPFVAALVFGLFLLIGRGLRGVYRWLAKLLNRWIGRRAARGIGWVVVVGLTYLVVSGLLLQGFVSVMNNAYSLRDTKTAEGIQQPTTSLRSGGPGSYIPWDSLGWQGRNFIGKGPSVSDVGKFTGHPAMAPIRIYAGLASADGPAAQAALAAGRALFDAVYGAWVKLPAGDRPKLYVAGESLGSFGGEAAFTGENDLANRTSGALFVGPPNFNTLFRAFSDHRDPGSPEIQPIYAGGRIVRFSNDPGTGIPPAGEPWNGSRILYLMHPSDPIVWWSPHLIFSEPDWISEPPGKDVLKTMFWIPFVTFWEVTADLPFATGVPGGHGHKYTAEYVDGWNAVMRAGLSAADLASLRKIIAAGG
jgi:uncharacterized membrane protein